MPKQIYSTIIFSFQDNNNMIVYVKKQIFNFLVIFLYIKFPFTFRFQLFNNIVFSLNLRKIVIKNCNFKICKEYFLYVYSIIWIIIVFNIYLFLLNGNAKIIRRACHLKKVLVDSNIWISRHSIHGLLPRNTSYALAIIFTILFFLQLFIFCIKPFKL